MKPILKIVRANPTFEEIVDKYGGFRVEKSEPSLRKLRICIDLPEKPGFSFYTHYCVTLQEAMEEVEKSFLKCTGRSSLYGDESNIKHKPALKTSHLTLVKIDK